MLKLLDNYKVNPGTFDEVKQDKDKGSFWYKEFLDLLSGMQLHEFEALNESAKLSFLNQGVTYALYNKEESVEQIFPFDLSLKVG